MTRRVLAWTCLAMLTGIGVALADEIVVDDYVDVPTGKEFDVISEYPSGDLDYVWMPGYWDYTLDGWAWVDGNWAVPPDEASYWVPGYWKWENEKWHWESGHWAISDTGLGWIVDEYIEPPAKLDEVRPDKPSDKNHWVAGYWDWDGTWFWVPGYWTNKPNPDAEWVDGHWHENFVTGKWHWVGGHWSVQ